MPPAPPVASPDSAAPSFAEVPHLRRALGLWDAACVVIGAIIGVGIFFTPREVARLTGSPSGAMLAWAIGGVIALLGAFTFAELGRLRPRAGGQYHVLHDAFGAMPSFLFVFCNLTAVQAGAVAIIAILCVQHLGIALYGHEPPGRWVTGLGTLMVWSLVGVNVLGVRAGARVQDATVVAKLAILAAVVAVALFFRPGPATAGAVVAASVRPGFVPIFAGVTVTMFAYGGGQQLLWVGGEVKDPLRNIPRALIVGVGLVVVTYLAASWAFLHLLGFDGLRSSSALAADALSVVSPGLGRRLAAAAVAISAFGVLNAQFLTGPRLTWAMANEGQFFRAFAGLHPRHLTPVAAIVLLGGLATALLAGLGLERTDLLTTGVVVVDGAFFALTGFALPVLRARTPVADRGPAWISVAAVAFSLLELFAIVASVLARDVRLIALTGLGWIGAAALTWWIGFRGRTLPART